MSAWTSYEPDSSHPWNLSRVVHLHRRCVFGACRAELVRDLAADPQECVTRLLNGTCRIPVDSEAFTERAKLLGQLAVDSGNPQRLKAWWIFRILFGPHPLKERVTLAWHNHFATSNLKVDNLRQMFRQNETFRTHAFAPFDRLLRASLREPALLRWLDAPSNRKGHPNENLARELMELFTIGAGKFREQDVVEGARALTGWTVEEGTFRMSRDSHDHGEKTILGETGSWDGDDFVSILLRHPSTARRLAWRLTQEFCGEGVVDDGALDELANGLAKRDLDVRWGVETILRSQLFFSNANLRSRICDPVTFLVAPLRAVECWRSSPSTLILAEWLRRFGQDLFYPLNVGGWTGGRDWLDTRALVARANYAVALAAGELENPAAPPDLPDLSYKELRPLLGDAQGDEAVMENHELVKILTSPAAHLH